MLKTGKREQNKVKCRQRILESTRRLFTEKGYESTTIGDIAEAAGVSKATLYNYFPSKETLLIGMADTALEEIRQMLREDREDCSALELLRRVVETLALDSVHYLTLTRRILYLNSFPESSLYGTRQELLRIFTALVAEARDQGDLRRDMSVEELADGFLGIYLLTQFGWEKIAGYTDDECAERVNRMIDQALAGLRPPEKEN